MDTVDLFRSRLLALLRVLSHAYSRWPRQGVIGLVAAGSRPVSSLPQPGYVEIGSRIPQARCRVCNSRVELLIHLNPPLWSVFLHRPDDGEPADPTDNPKPREKPSIANGVNQRLGNDSSHTTKDISDEVVDRHTTTRTSWHEPECLISIAR